MPYVASAPPSPKISSTLGTRLGWTPNHPSATKSAAPLASGAENGASMGSMASTTTRGTPEWKAKIAAAVKGKHKLRQDATCGHGGKAKAFGLCITCYRHLYFENHHKVESDRAHRWQVEHYESAAAHKRRWRAEHPDYDAEYRRSRKAALEEIERLKAKIQRLEEALERARVTRQKKR